MENPTIKKLRDLTAIMEQNRQICINNQILLKKKVEEIERVFGNVVPLELKQSIEQMDKDLATTKIPSLC